MNGGQRTLIVIGRMFLGAIFIIAGINKIFNWQIMEEGIISTLCDWHVYVHGQKYATTCVQSLMPWGPFILGVAAFLELVGGILVFLGVKVRWGAFFLFVFIIPTTILYHHFWFLEGQKRDMETLEFLKNLAILGGVMILWAFGPIRRKQMQPPSHTGGTPQKNL